MATTYSASKVATTVMARAGIEITSVFSTYEAAVALVINDVIKMIKVPKGATILELVCAVDDLDTGTTITLDVGDGTTANRFIAADTTARSGGLFRFGSGISGAAAANCLNYTYTADDVLQFKVHAAPTGGGTGTMSMNVIYTMQS